MEWPSSKRPRPAPALSDAPAICAAPAPLALPSALVGGGGGAPVAAYRSLEWSDLDTTRFFLVNPVIFFALRVLQHPANVIKTRFQTQQRRELYPSIRSTVRATLAREGVRGLYRGFSTSCVLLVVQQAYIVMYERLRARETYEGGALAGLSEPARNGLAAAVAVFAVQTIANPVDVVVQRKMLQGQICRAAPGGGGAAPLESPSRILSAREIARDVYRTRGLHGFFSGFFISCLQFVPSASLWWWSYPQFRDAMLPPLLLAHAAWARATDEDGGGGGAAAARAAPAAVVPPAAAFRIAEVLSGSLASATVAVTLNPVDIVRTRTQVEGSPALSVLRGLLAAEGVRGLWKGVLPRIAMLVPQGALSVTAYEFVKRVAARDPSARMASPVELA